MVMEDKTLSASVGDTIDTLRNAAVKNQQLLEETRELITRLHDSMIAKHHAGEGPDAEGAQKGAGIQQELKDLLQKMEATVSECRDSMNEIKKPQEKHIDPDSLKAAMSACLQDSIREGSLRQEITDAVREATEGLTRSSMQQTVNSVVSTAIAGQMDTITKAVGTVVEEKMETFGKTSVSAENDGNEPKLPDLIRTSVREELASALQPAFEHVLTSSVRPLFEDALRNAAPAIANPSIDTEGNATQVADSAVPHVEKSEGDPSAPVPSGSELMEFVRKEIRRGHDAMNADNKQAHSDQLRRVEETVKVHVDRSTRAVEGFLSPLVEGLDVVKRTQEAVASELQEMSEMQTQFVRVSLKALSDSLASLDKSLSSHMAAVTTELSALKSQPRTDAEHAAPATDAGSKVSGGAPDGAVVQKWVDVIKATQEEVAALRTVLEDNTR
eukprot:Rmarinus@m.12836